MDENQLEEIFKIVNDVFEARILHSEGVNKLESLGSISNAGDLIQNYKCMREGSQYTRPLIGEMTKFFLKKIHKEFSDKALYTALKAVRKHTNYYEGIRGAQIPYLRNIVNSFENILEADKPKNVRFFVLICFLILAMAIGYMSDSMYNENNENIENNENEEREINTPWYFYENKKSFQHIFDDGNKYRVELNIKIYKHLDKPAKEREITKELDEFLEEWFEGWKDEHSGDFKIFKERYHSDLHTLYLKGKIMFFLENNHFEQNGNDSFIQYYIINVIIIGNWEEWDLRDFRRGLRIGMRLFLFIGMESVHMKMNWIRDG